MVRIRTGSGLAPAGRAPEPHERPPTRHDGDERRSDRHGRDDQAGGPDRRDAAAAPALAAVAGATVADAFLGVTGWMETNRPSQIIRLGAYRQGVKNRRNWATVSFVFGFMS